MQIAFVVAAALVVVALIGLLGRVTDQPARMSQIVVYALPLGIVSAGYAASTGITLMWAIVAFAAVVVGALLASRLGPQRALVATDDAAGAAGLGAAAGALITLGLAGVGVIWAANLVASFSALNRYIIAGGIVAAGVAIAVGGAALKALSRTVLFLVIIGAVAMAGLGYSTGSPAGLTSPEIPLPAPSPAIAALYALGIVLIGAAYPLLRATGAVRGLKVGIGGLIVAAVCLTAVLGMLMLYGGSFSLPSLVINVFPGYAPMSLSAVICALIALIGAVLAGVGIRAALIDVDVVMTAQRATWRTVGLGVVVFIIAVLAPTPDWIVLTLSLLAVVSLLTDWRLGRLAKRQADTPTAIADSTEPATASTTT